MNTYKITVTLPDNTSYEHQVTERNECSARLTFKRAHKGESFEIVSTELVRENVSATKQQERDALEKIKELVELMGPNSYIATAFQGCFEIAEQNIEYDFADSLQERLAMAEKKAEALKAKADDADRFLAQFQEMREKWMDVSSQLTNAQTTLDGCYRTLDRKQEEIDRLKAEKAIADRLVLSGEELGTAYEIVGEKVTALEAEVKNLSEIIVESAGDPSSAIFQNAVKDHRAAKAELERFTSLHARIIRAMGAGA